MKREIKFRAWNGRSMRQVDQITIGENTWSCDGGYGVSIPYQPHVHLMQYTGLKDRNGKEIYEGDIIQVSDFEETKGECMFFDGSFKFKEGEAMSNLNAYPPVLIEIIGNIYETKTSLTNE